MLYYISHFTPTHASLSIEDVANVIDSMPAPSALYVLGQDSAGTAKETFIQLWNPVAAKYGITPQSSSSI